jgi:hypothetical protein
VLGLCGTALLRPWQYAPREPVRDASAARLVGPELAALAALGPAQARAAIAALAGYTERQRARLEVHYELGVVGADLTNRLANECDLNLGMGLSVLEGAAVGVPSIYVAPQENAASTAYWQWVHDRAASDFGPGPFWGESCDPFDFSALHCEQGGLMDRSMKSLAYAESYHSIRTVAHRLLRLSPRATLVDYLDAHGKLFGVLERFGGS